MTVLTASRDTKIIQAPFQNIEMSQLKNGAKLLSIKQKSDLSRVVISINAGSRFEGENEKGICHVIRHMIFGSNRFNTIISNTRALFQIGADVAVECTRDSFFIKTTFANRYLFHVLDLIGSAISYPKLQYHEVAHALRSCLVDCNNLRSNLMIESVLEELHSKIFRNGYGNSLFLAPDFVSKIRENKVEDYMNKNFTSDRLAVAVSSDLSHIFVEEYVNETFILLKSLPLAPPIVKSYSGESVIPHDFRYCHTAFGFPAVGQSDNNWAVFSVLQKYLGVCDYTPTFSSTQSRLRSVLDDDISIKTSCFYIPYVYTGIFGIYTIAPLKNYTHSIHKVCKAIQKITTEEIHIETLNRAIALARFEIVSRFTDISTFLADSTLSLSCGNELCSLTDQIHKLQSVTSEDLKNVLTKIGTTRPVCVSIGNPSSIPAADDIISWIQNE